MRQARRVIWRLWAVVLGRGHAARGKVVFEGWALVRRSTVSDKAVFVVPDARYRAQQGSHKGPARQ